jgi:hypothetical protein
MESRLLPNDGDTKPCKKCDGVMIFRSRGGFPGSRAGTGLPDGSTVWAGRLVPSWMCDKNADHYELLD